MMSSEYCKQCGSVTWHEKDFKPFLMSLLCTLFTCGLASPLVIITACMIKLRCMVCGSQHKS